MMIAWGREFFCLLLSLLLHGVVLAFLFLEWTSPPVRVQTSIPSLQVSLVALRPPPPIPSAAPVAPPAEPLSSLSAPPPMPPPRPVPEEESPVPEEVEPPVPASSLRDLPPAAEFPSLPAAAEPAADPAAPYVAEIAQVIASHWSRPPDARREMKAELLIQLVPTGEVIGVRMLRGSGHPSFDAAAEAAVWRSGGFPKIRDMPRSLFEKRFRNLQLIFRPEDLPR